MAAHENAFAGRVAINDWLDGYASAAVRADACLLTSELISNSVRHAGMPSGTPLRLTAGVLDGMVRVAITDHGHAGAVRRRKPDARGGYGLNLLQLIAAHWGVERNHGTQVWFELATRPS
jgi:anti-sigma regulatory factor (Ser/Thr protein kinase)